jgi:Helix-turn-helix domain
MSDEERTVVDFRKHKFIQVTRQVIDNDSVLSKPVDIAVYTVLCMYADNDTKTLHPSVKTIAKKARCSERVARRSLLALKEAGYIDIVERFNSEGKQMSNQYVLLDVDTPDKKDTDPLSKTIGSPCQNG